MWNKYDLISILYMEMDKVVSMKTEKFSAENM